MNPNYLNAIKKAAHEERANIVISTATRRVPNKRKAKAKKYNTQHWIKGGL